MQILNLINKERSDIDYSLSRFPDGEIQITLGEFSRKKEINVRCRITSAEELFVLMQTCDILVRHGMRFSISIYYLMGMRMDRVMDFNRPYTLKIIVNILDHLGATEIDLFNPHSEAALDLFKITDAREIYSEEWSPLIEQVRDECQVVIPDAGAVERYFPYEDEVPEGIIIGEKVRDIKTGKIMSIKVKNPEALDGRPLAIIDDLCDGGGTFVGLAEAIRQVKPDAVISIAVGHMVNPKGIENLSKNFNHVFFTNSFKDWNGFKSEYGKAVPNLPDNVTQIEVV